jgi:hypothetical protein
MEIDAKSGTASAAGKTGQDSLQVEIVNANDIKLKYKPNTAIHSAHRPNIASLCDRKTGDCKNARSLV